MIKSLRPFEINAITKDVQLQVDVQRDGSLLMCEFTLLDPKSSVILKSGIFGNQRKKELWKSTCLEIFWKRKEEEKYWEFNLSSDLNWNIFSFDQYRQPQEREDLAFKSVNFSKKSSTPVKFYIELDLALSGIVQEKIQVGITSVLEHNNQQKSYWALTHKGEKPDFHLKESFIDL